MLDFLKGYNGDAIVNIVAKSIPDALTGQRYTHLLQGNDDGLTTATTTPSSHE